MTAHEGSSSEPLPGPAVNTTPSTLLCTKCRKPLEGQFVRALEGTFHQDCFTCIDCNKPVASRFFPIEAADGTQQPLCELDYFRRLNLVCASCGDALKGSYITALGKKYHVGHFCCAACSVVFGPDDSYYEYDNNVYCYYHYSIKFAIKCSGCQTAILKQFLDINRNGIDEHWHPECYMIHKYWNVKISQSISEEGDNAIKQEQDLSKLTPDQLREVQEAMEIKVYRIWTVLSAFEESAAACISDMLVHVSGGSYIEGLKMADYFVTHVEVVFAAIDDLVAQYQSKGRPEPKYRKESKLLCRKIINFFTLLSHARETGLRPIGLTEELLSLVTGLAHYLKVLIRISLTAALNLDSSQDGQSSPISRFLEQLVELANRQTYSFDDDSLSSLDCDTCQFCHETCEDQCFRLAHMRWHDGCFACSKCCLPLRDQYTTAFWDPKDATLLCKGCGSSGTGLKQGFEHVSRLQQFGFLLRVALRRLYGLLDVNEVPTQKTPAGKSPPGFLTQDSRAKSFTDGQSTKETIHLGDIKRMKSTQLRRKLTDSHRVAKRSTILETPSPTVASVASEASDNDICESPTAIQGTNNLNYPPAQRPTNMQNSTSDGALSLGSILQNAHQKEGGVSTRPPSQVYSKNKPVAKFSYIAELSALNHFMVKHIAVLHLEELLKGYFTLEELVDLIDDKKGNSLWGKFVTGLKTGGSKKAPRSKEATFGVPLEALIERTGVESHLGAGASGIRIPAFVEDCISAMKKMDMSVEGIFRKNGNIRRLKDIAEEIDANANVQLVNEGPVQIAALIKKFLRDLPEPLLTFKLYKLFTVVNKLESLEDRKRVLHLSCLLLPKPNRDTMEVLFLFLKWVSTFAYIEEGGGGNKMDTLNLATMLAPNILESKNKDPAKDESFAGIEAVRLLLEYQQDFCMVPEDFVLLLESLSYGKGDMEASARDILRKCELVMKLKKPQPQPNNLPAMPVRQHSSPAIMPTTPSPDSQPQELPSSTTTTTTTATPSTPLPDLSSSPVNASSSAR